MAKQASQEEAAKNEDFRQEAENQMEVRRIVGIEGAVNRSIGELSSFTDKDVPHFLSAAANAAVASVCVYFLVEQKQGIPAPVFPAAAALIVWLATWEYEELNFAYFGGVLIATSRVLRRVYLFSDYEQIVWTLLKTWLATGTVLFLLLVFVVGASHRRKLKRHKRVQHLAAEHEKRVN